MQFIIPFEVASGSEGRWVQAWHSPASGGVDLQEGLRQAREQRGGSNWGEKSRF